MICTFFIYFNVYLNFYNPKLRKLLFKYFVLCTGIYKDKAAVCFADYCDIMRCDIIAGRRKKEFWDVSLCLESDMKDLMDDCEVHKE